MSNSRSVKDRVEKRRLAVEANAIEINLYELLNKLELLGPSYKQDEMGVRSSTEAFFRWKMLVVVNDIDLSGEKWDDNYNPKNGRDS